MEALNEILAGRPHRRPGLRARVLLAFRHAHPEDRDVLAEKPRRSAGTSLAARPITSVGPDTVAAARANADRSSSRAHPGAPNMIGIVNDRTSPVMEPFRHAGVWTRP